MPDTIERPLPPPAAPGRTLYSNPPMGALAWLLSDWAPRLPAGLLHVTARNRDVAAIAAMARGFAPDLEIVELPAWDSLPYDRARPSRTVTGARVAGLARLAEAPALPRLVVTSAAGLLQRTPFRARLAERRVRLAVGDEIDPEWLRRTLEAFGYNLQERVEEPGEAALHGAASDVFPAGAARPVRLEIEDGRIGALHEFDPADQRSTDPRDAVTLLPATEGFAVPGEPIGEVAEHLLPEGELETLFDALPGATISLHAGAEERLTDWLETIADAWEACRIFGQAGLDPPERLYLRAREVAGALEAHPVAAFAPDAGAAIAEGIGEPPRTIAELAASAAAHARAGAGVVICATGIAGLSGRLGRRLGQSPELLGSWRKATKLRGGSIGLLDLPLADGVRLGKLVLLAAGPVIPRPRDRTAPLLGEEVRVGDLVVEREHGLATLAALTLVEEDANARECLNLQFAADQRLLVTAEEADQVWRYGSADASAAPDRLSGEAWRARRMEVEREITEMANGIAERQRARAAAAAPRVAAPRGAFDRFVRRVPYALTEDQRAAIEATLADMARPHPMERLVCGDVGFGKTEVALHAAATAALAGFQVAVAAPTTLLARQHAETFARRLGGLGLNIATLIRSTRTAEARGVLAGLRSGEVDIVIGTHSLASASVRFANLGLVVIDEEQRFGDAQKRRLHALRHAASPRKPDARGLKQRGPDARVHALTMTATPLPRSLQAALLGLFDVSVLATPPVSRLPVRTFVIDYDPAVTRAALLREARRGGQSFVVCPRIDDLAPMAERLAALVPKLTVVQAHGKLGADALDRVMLDYAAGRADVLLTTSIIEAGLDLPNANTMLIWRPDRFGLAQLHQLRGRVGRGRARASVYLLIDPAHPPGGPARKRLHRLAELSSLGAGFAVSAADLDQRGAGDILGERQAGHVRLMGSELYGHTLTRSLAEARGEKVPADWSPTLAIDAAAYVPADIVPEPDLRLDLYWRLARLSVPTEIDALGEEIEDRFGTLPPQTAALLDLARLRLACRRLGIGALHAGPSAVALTARDDTDVPALVARLGTGLQMHWSRERLVLEIAEPVAERRMERVLAALAGA